MKNLEKFIKYSLYIIVIITPILPLMLLLKFKGVIFFNPLDPQILIIDFFLISLIVLFTRSFIISALIFYLWVLAPFVSYYFLRRGIHYSDIGNFNELIYFFGIPLTILLCLILFLIFIVIIYNNFKNFSKVLLTLQICSILLISSFLNTPEFILNSIYKDQPKQNFNTSANFRFMGVSNAFIESMLDYKTFKSDLRKHSLLKEYKDFRNFEDTIINKKNIHIIVLESYLDLEGFNDLDFDDEIFNEEWIDGYNSYNFTALSPVIGGSSAQAEFEILCGVKSNTKYGLAFNRLGGKPIPCLPNVLKGYGYSTFASQPVYGSFFNTKKAYKSVGFDHIWLAESFDMSSALNGWLPDELFFDRHIELISPYLKMDKPIINYLFAVGCHVHSNIKKNSYPKNISFNTSERTSSYLNCYLSTRYLVRDYINKINKLNSNNIFIILPDHIPPIKSNKLKKNNIDQFLNSNLIIRNTNNEGASELTIINGHINYGYLLHKGNISYENSFAYYEIPEILMQLLSNGELCNNLDCISSDAKILFKNGYVDRHNFNNLPEYTKSNKDNDYQAKLNTSLIKQSNSDN